MDKANVEYVVDERTWKEKLSDWKDRQVQRAKDGIQWCVDHPEFGIPIVLAAVKGGQKVITNASRAYTVEKEIRFRQCSIYDRSMGRYIELKRPLTDYEAMIIEERRHNGEGLMAILSSMNLVKRR